MSTCKCRIISIMMIIGLFLPQLLLSQSLNSKYSCGLTREEYTQTKEVVKRKKKHDKKVIRSLEKIDPEYAWKYSSLQNQEEKNEFIEYLVNHKFNVIGHEDPTYEKIGRFYKLFTFGIVSAKDIDRCYPVSNELHKKYGDSIKFYLDAIAHTGCEIKIYNVTKWEKINEICCFLKKVSDRYKTGTLYIHFYEREVFEPSRKIDDDATVVARGEEILIDKVIINYLDDLKKSK